MATKFTINKGVNRSLEFKGIKAQYIIYLCLGFIVLLLLFVILYVVGVNSYICLGLTTVLAIIFYLTIQYYSKKYGEHGLARHGLRNQLPGSIISQSRTCFTILSSVRHEKREENGGHTSRVEGGK